MILGRMPGPHQPGMHQQQQVLVMQRPGMPPGANGPPLVRAPIRPGSQGTFIDRSIVRHFLILNHFSGVPVSSNSMTVMPGQHPSNYYPGQPGQGVSVHPRFASLSNTRVPHFSLHRTAVLIPVNRIPIPIFAVPTLVTTKRT